MMVFQSYCFAETHSTVVCRMEYPVNVLTYCGSSAVQVGTGMVMVMVAVMTSL